MVSPVSARFRDAFRPALFATLTAIGLLSGSAVGARTDAPAPRNEVPRVVPAGASDPAEVLHARTESAMAEWLRGTRIAASDIGLFAMPLDGDLPLLAHDAGQPYNPASTMKLLTTIAAVSILGPQHRWRTDAALRGVLRDGVLDGDLVLTGGGDPKLVVEDLQGFVARMRAAGLQEIRGDLVVDDALFDVGADSVERFDRELSQPYNVRPHPLLLNFKASRLVASPARDGVSLRFDPPLAGVAIEDRVRRVSGPCKAGAEGLTVAESGPGQAPAVRVGGRYAPACGEVGVFVSVLSHRQFIDALFRAVWLASGGRWSGEARFERWASRGLTPWQSWESPRTLAEVVRDINKLSNNVMARELLLLLAPDAGRSTVTIEDARRGVLDWFAAQGLVLPGAFVDNGSGLSRDARLSAASLVQLLRFAAAGPHAELIRESLPVVGVDGTMKRRLGGDPVAGRAWIKTGSLADVRSIAGYVDGRSGRRYAVALLVNGPHADRARTVQDRFLQWMYRNG